MNAVDMHALRTAVVADLRTHYEGHGLKLKFEPHGGRFDITELDRYGISAPEIRVAILSNAREEKGRGAHLRCQLAAYIVSGRDRYLLASERGLVIASSLQQYLSQNAPGGAASAGQPERIAWQNLYAADAGERNKHLGVVTWWQLFEVTGASNAPALDDLLLVACTYDLAESLDGAPEATDDIALPGPDA